jgi:tetratricopeptide (TPR) repeat protein
MTRVDSLRRLAPIANRRAGFHPAPLGKLNHYSELCGKPRCLSKIGSSVLCCVFVPLLLASQAGPGIDELNDGKIALTAHDYVAAADKFRAALASAEEEAVKLDALTQLAAASRLLGRPDEAEQALKQAAPLGIKLHGDTSLEVAAILSSMSGAQRALGRGKDAVLSIESALRMRELHPTEKLLDFASDLFSAAKIRIDLDDTRAAQDLLTRALGTCEKALPSESPQCLRMLDELAGILRSRSEYAQAEPLYVRALRLREAVDGPNDPDLIATLDSLAYVYFGLKRYEDAEPVYRRLLALWEASAGPDHPMVAVTLDKMAEFYAAQERYAEAEPLTIRATTIRTNALIDSLKRAGRVYLQDLGRDTEVEGKKP